MGTVPTREEMYRAQEERHGAELQKKLSDSTVAVCGLGGLGSNIAICLARAGIGRLILIDFDRVDITNLHRQQYKASQVGMYKAEALSENLREIAPYVELSPHVCHITPDNLPALLRAADIICEAFDGAEQKAMLVDGVFAHFPRKCLVSSSGMAGIGSANQIRTRRITDRFILCGDGSSEVSKENCLFASRVMVCAAHEAHAVIRQIAGEKDA